MRNGEVMPETPRFIYETTRQIPKMSLYDRYAIVEHSNLFLSFLQSVIFMSRQRH